MDLTLNLSDLPYTDVAISSQSINNISTSIEFNSNFESPLAINTSIGAISLRVDDVEYFSINILNSNEIKKKTVYDYLSYFIKDYFTCINNMI